MQPHANQPPDQDLPALQAGWNHLEEGRWKDARGSFRTALDQEESPEALEGLSWAAWWLDDAEEVFGARERAFLLYRKREQPADAARMAIWIAVDHLDFRGETAVARGWLGRAGSLLEGVAPGPEHGWLAFHEGYLAQAGGDLERADERARRTTALGRELGVPDLEMLGLGLHGSVLVTRGDVDQGMALLDEGTAVAVSGETKLPISAAWTCCFLVGACERVRDFPRAFQWCRQIEAFVRRYGSRYMLGFCRAHYGVVYLMEGRWEEAEAALEEALSAYSRSRPAYRPGVLATLAELRRRQGRWEDAERLLDESGPSRVALICRARLALDRGEALRAAELAERRLRRASWKRAVERTDALEVLVWAQLARRHPAGAEEALDEFRKLADAVGTPLLQSAVHMAAGGLAAASGSHDRARKLLEDAADGFRSCQAPFEAARAGLALARSLAALDRPKLARREARTACDAFDRLGATAEARRARQLLEALEADSDADTPLPQLTPRQREVLALVARGLTNEAVARRLHISEHTVHRHVSNILRKLDVSSRTAAASRAVGAGLLDEDSLG